MSVVGGTDGSNSVGGVVSGGDVGDKDVYVACQMHLTLLEQVPKLKSVSSRAHNVSIQAEELEAIQLALEDQLSWATRRNLCLSRNLQLLTECPQQNLQISASSLFPYLAQSPSTHNALLTNNNPIQNTTSHLLQSHPTAHTPHLSPSPFKLEQPSSHLSLSSNQYSPNRSASSRKDNSLGAQPSCSQSSISPVENLTKAKSETPYQFWKYVDNTYCAKLSDHTIKNFLLPICRNYEPEVLSQLFEVPDPSSDTNCSNSTAADVNSVANGDNTCNGFDLNDDIINGNDDTHSVPFKKSKLTSRKQVAASKEKEKESTHGKHLKKNGKNSVCESESGLKEVCSVGPLTQLLISSLISTKQPTNQNVENNKGKTKVSQSQSSVDDDSVFDWMSSREQCRLENVLRKELKKIGLLDVAEDGGLDCEEGAGVGTLSGMTSSSSSAEECGVGQCVRLDCGDEVMCALRSKQCELDVLVDANKAALKSLYLKSVDRIRRQEMELKADALDLKLKEQYAKVLACKSAKKSLSKREQDHIAKLLDEWKTIYSNLNLF